jgi:hypothetical protein
VSANSSNEDIVLFGYYRHYKGKTYFVVGEATHTETGEQMVIYRQADDSNFQIWVRPKALFLSEVEVGDKKVPRFEYIPFSPTDNDEPI